MRAGLVGEAAALAHECGHVLGFGHAPCGLTPGDPNDPAYPAYEPYDIPAARQASIGGYGVDLYNNSVASPAMTRDFMSYCSPQWIGPYHHRALIGHPLLDPRHLIERGPKLPDWVNDQFLPDLDLPRTGPVALERPLIRNRTNPVQRLILVSGILRGSRLEQLSVLRLPSRQGAAGEIIPGVTVEIRDGKGLLVDRARLRRAALFSTGCGCQGGEHGGLEPEPGFESGLVGAVLPDRDDLGEVRMIRGEEVLWSRRADDEPPSLEKLTAQIEEEALQVRWVVRRASAETYYIVRWSGDPGKDWETLTILPGGPATTDREKIKAHITVAALRPGAAWIEVVGGSGTAQHRLRSRRRRDPGSGADGSDPMAARRRSGPDRLTGSAVGHGRLCLGREARRRYAAADAGRPPGRAVRGSDGRTGRLGGRTPATLTVHTESGKAEASVTFLATCSGDPPLRQHRQRLSPLRITVTSANRGALFGTF